MTDVYKTASDNKKINFQKKIPQDFEIFGKINGTKFATSLIQKDKYHVKQGFIYNVDRGKKNDGYKFSWSAISTNVNLLNESKQKFNTGILLKKFMSSTYNPVNKEISYVHNLFVINI